MGWMLRFSAGLATLASLSSCLPGNGCGYGLALFCPADAHRPKSDSTPGLGPTLYYELSKDYTCADRSGAAVPSYKRKIVVSADGISVHSDKCSNESQVLSQSDLTVSVDSSVLAYEHSLFERATAEPTGSPTIIGFCYDDGSERRDVVLLPQETSYRARISRAIPGGIYANTAENVARTTSEERDVFSAPDFDLAIDTHLEPGPSGYPGELFLNQPTGEPLHWYLNCEGLYPH